MKTISRYVVVAQLVTALAAVAHPGVHDSWLPHPRVDPGVLTPGSEATTSQRMAGTAPLLSLPLFDDQVRDGYHSSVCMSVGQVAHVHHKAGSGKGADLGPPAEVWYAASVKPVDDKQGSARFCVSPRVELPGGEGWSPQVKIKLIDVSKTEPGAALLAEVESTKSLPVGASLELASSGPWCVIRNLDTEPAPSTLYLVTQHGSGLVRFPAVKSVVSGSSGEKVWTCSSPSVSGKSAEPRQRSRGKQ